MEIKNKELKKMVNVSRKECPTFDCYWPRAHPGIFTQGQGYKSCDASIKGKYICGNREIRGCPDHPIAKLRG